MAKIFRREIKREVRIGLDPMEREPLVKDMLRLRKKSQSLKLQAKDTQAGFRKDIKEVDDQLDEVCASLDRGRPVLREVEEIVNPSTGIVKYRDIELDRIVEERPMTAEDDQLSLGQRSGEEEKDIEKAKDIPKAKTKKTAGGTDLAVAH